MNLGRRPHDSGDPAMHILQAERDALLKPLNAVTGIVERRHPADSANVLIEKRGNALSFGHRPEIRSPPPARAMAEDFRLTTSAKTPGHPARAARRRHGDAGPNKRQAHPESRQEPL